MVRIIGSEKYLVNGTECNTGGYEDNQAFYEVEHFYHLQAKTNLPKPFIDLENNTTN